MPKTKGFIFNIQKFCVHDGPGIRTTVFLKGCPLRCRWCANPESQQLLPQIGYKATECLRCHSCVQACPEGALKAAPEGLIEIDRRACHPESTGQEGNAPCATVCSSDAIFVYGKSVDAGSVIAELEQDASFYARSGGGLTLSGGEPLFQPEFTLALLSEARATGIPVAMETSAFAPKEVLHEVCAHLSYLIMDIKLSNSEKHKYWTGVGNELILENYLYIRENFPDLPMKIRTPLIPGVNDTREEIQGILDFLKPLKPTAYELLPYHQLGKNKYTFLGRNYEMQEVALMKEREVELNKLVMAEFA